ncbi:heat shock protein 23-like [Aethina tumida]|uniref:heat shock protein 23-like n=1 Tax=Aethina tumida TaxID=116153 RepID=UPI00096B26BF|nr:heat shock protein 23-like [Aethina tumida]
MEFGWHHGHGHGPRHGRIGRPRGPCDRRPFDFRFGDNRFGFDVTVDPHEFIRGFGDVFNPPPQRQRRDVTTFRLQLDMQQFEADQIKVKVSNENTIVVEAKHENKPDEYGTVSRHFQRKIVLPQEYDIAKVESRFSMSGVLTITAPRKDGGEVEIQVIHDDDEVEMNVEPHD